MNGTLLSSKYCPAKLTTYSPAYFFNCQLIQVLACRPIRWIQVSQFIYWAFMHHPSAKVPTCLLIPRPIGSIAYSSKYWPARWRQVPQFIYWTLLHPHSAIVPTCLLIPLHIFPISYSSKCRPARWLQVPVHLLYISASSKCWPASLPTISTCVANKLFLCVY